MEERPVSVSTPDNFGRGTTCNKQIPSNEAWLRKPYRMDELANAVRGILDAR